MGRLALDDCIQTMAYRGFVAMVQEDDILKRVVNTWLILDGSAETLQPPVTTQMPWICVAPATDDWQKAEEASYEVTLSLACAVATEGLDYADHANLWAAFTTAINQEKAFRDTRNDLWMRAQGCFLYGMKGGAPVPIPIPRPGAEVKSQDLFSQKIALLKLRIDF